LINLDKTTKAMITQTKTDKMNEEAKQIIERAEQLKGELLLEDFSSKPKMPIEEAIDFIIWSYAIALKADYRVSPFTPTFTKKVMASNLISLANKAELSANDAKERLLAKIGCDDIYEPLFYSIASVIVRPIDFKVEFANQIKTGEKTQTIRKWPHVAEVGDILELYVGLKTEIPTLLKRVVLTEKKQMRVGWSRGECIFEEVGNRPYSDDELENIAKLDGFPSFVHMFHTIAEIYNIDCKPLAHNSEYLTLLKWETV